MTLSFFFCFLRFFSTLGSETGRENWQRTVTTQRSDPPTVHPKTTQHTKKRDVSVISTPNNGIYKLGGVIDGEYGGMPGIQKEVIV
ncbi:uncharacterized protein EV422DRAFT_540497, partial [Fimicolochytrium jonesii]|uniref:uncharacterized protein n=1 Tax=Fimicolochytrium jonesii TaxID=1396493 RepID=UPI0022FE5C64